MSQVFDRKKESIIRKVTNISVHLHHWFNCNVAVPGKPQIHISSNGCLENNEACFLFLPTKPKCVIQIKKTYILVCTCVIQCMCTRTHVENLNELQCTL